MATERLPATTPLQRFIEDCPRPGTEFPDFTAPLLGGGELELSSLRGRAVVMQTGSFT